MTGSLTSNPGLASVAGNQTTAPRRQKGLRRSIRWILPTLAVLTVLPTLLIAAGDEAAQGLPEAHGLPELVRTKQQVFTIPFNIPKPQSPDAKAERVLLSVSKDLGATWEPAGEAAPTAGSFSYRAGPDGEYWFRLRAVDSKGRMRGGAGPDLRVLVDAAGPRIAARCWKGKDGEIVCRYAAVDDSLRLDSLIFEYRSKNDPAWKKIAAVGILSRESPAHLVGEEIWWAGEQVDAVTVRIAIADSSGNRTVRQYSLEPSDPQVDQNALARELGMPGLSSEEPPPIPEATPQPPSPPASMAVGSPPSSGWNPESAPSWSGDSPNIAKGSQSVLVKPSESAVAGSLVSHASSMPAATQDALRLPVGASSSIPGSPSALQTSPLIEAPAPQTVAGQPLEYRGRPLQLVRARRFEWDYEFPSDASGAGPMRVELWFTRDGGVTWQRSAVDNDTISPIAVSLPAAGLYGFRLEVVPDVADAGSGPASGDKPDCWVGIDDEPPQPELIEIGRPQDRSGAVLIRYTVRDQLLVPRSTRLSFSQNPSGPWTTIAESLENAGEHLWQPPRGVPSRVFVRIEAADAAGNLGINTTPQAVVVAAPRVVGKLGGVRVAPSSGSP